MKMTKELWHELGFRECEKSHGTFVWEQYFGYGKYLEFDTERDWSFGQVIGKMFEEAMDCVDDLRLNKVTRDWGED